MGFIPFLLNLASRPRIQNCPHGSQNSFVGDEESLDIFVALHSSDLLDEVLFHCIYFCCCCSVAKSCPTLCSPMNCSMPGSSVLHYLPEFAQTHVHWVSDAIQPSYPLSLHSPLALQFFSLGGDNEKQLRSTVPYKDNRCMSKLVCPSWTLPGEDLW